MGKGCNLRRRTAYGAEGAATLSIFFFFQVAIFGQNMSVQAVKKKNRARLQPPPPPPNETCPVRIYKITFIGEEMSELHNELYLHWNKLNQSYDINGQILIYF